MRIPGPTSRWNCSRSWRLPHVTRSTDSAAASGERGAPAAVAAAPLSLVSQALLPDLHSLLHGGGRVPAALSLDGVLGPQHVLVVCAGMAPVLAEPLCARRGQRAGRGEFLYSVSRNPAAPAVRAAERLRDVVRTIGR